MEHLTCDLCGRPLLLDAPVRYEVKIEVKSAYDPMELTREDLEIDHRAEIQDLLRQLAGTDPKKAQDQVYAVFGFDLCARCQPGFLTDPLRRDAVRRAIAAREN